MIAAIWPACGSNSAVTSLRHRVRSASSPAGRPRREQVPGHQAAVHRVHPAVGVAHAHARERVAVIAAPDGEHPPPAGLSLPGHLHRDLDRHRPRVGQEHLIQRRRPRSSQSPRRRHLATAGASRRQPHQPPAELNGWFVGEPAEHHVAHLVQLRPRRGIQLGHGVPVDGTPPRRHRVDDLARFAVNPQAKPGPGRGFGQIRRAWPGHRRVGMPQVVAVEVHHGRFRGPVAGHVNHPSRSRR